MLAVNQDTPEALVNNVVHLISLPTVYTRLEEILKNPEHTRNDIAEVINIDPALCARILRIINSSYYGLPNTIQSINLAVNLIGEYDLRNMVLITSVINAMEALLDHGIDMPVFWRHSIRCGISARLMAKLTATPDPELLFLIGLLHDLGQLIIYKNEPELSATVAWHVLNENKKRYQIEASLLGFDHAMVGALLAETWGLPSKLNDIIKYHHQPDRSTYAQETKLICLADQLAHLLELNNNALNSHIEHLPIPITRSLQNLHIQKDQILALLSDVLEQSQSIEEIICDA